MEQELKSKKCFLKDGYLVLMESYISTINDTVDCKHVQTNALKTFPHVCSTHMQLIFKSNLRLLSKRVHRVTFLHHSVKSEGESLGGQPDT